MTISFAFLIVAFFAPPLADSTVDQQPRVFKAEAKSTNLETELLFSLGEPVIIRADVERAPKSSIRWRVRGGVEYETFANDTVLVIGWKPGRYEAEFLYIDYESGKYEEEMFVIVMGDLPPPDIVEPNKPTPTPTTPAIDKIDRVTVVYEKDEAVITPPVAKALSLLNRQGIIATEFEVDTVDGDNETPEQYREAKKAAEREGLPSAVFQSGAKVVSTIKILPATTTEQIMEAANAN